MKVTRYTMILALCLSGCMPLFRQHYAPQTATIHLTTTPDDAYTRAYSALSRMDASFTYSDKAMRILQADVHNAVRLHVSIEPSEKGSTITIHGAVMDNKIVTGEFDEITQLSNMLSEGSK